MKVNKLVSDWFFYLDIENFNVFIFFYEKEFIIIVNSSGWEDYFWEIGSGVNWLFYYVVIILVLY